MLEAENLRVDRGGREVLHVERLSVEAELVALMGPNGAGKTTLLEALHGTLPSVGRLETPDTWHVAADPPEPARVTPHALVAGHGVDDPERWLARVGYRGPDSLAHGSAGERRLVGLAGALGRASQASEMLLLDEPFGPLDPPHVARVTPLLARRAAEDAVLVATHDPQVAAHADRVLLLNHETVAAGPPDEVLQPAPLSTCYGAPMEVAWTDLGPIVRARPPEPDEPGAG